MGERSSGGVSALKSSVNALWDPTTLELLAIPQDAIPRGTIGVADADAVNVSHLIHRHGKHYAVTRCVDASNNWGIAIYPLRHDPARRYEPLISPYQRSTTFAQDLSLLSAEPDPRVTIDHSAAGVTTSIQATGLQIGGGASAAKSGFIYNDAATPLHGRKRIRVVVRGMLLGDTPVNAGQTRPVFQLGMIVPVAGNAVAVDQWDHPAWAIAFQATRIDVITSDGITNTNEIISDPSAWNWREKVALMETVPREMGVELDTETGQVWLLGDRMVPVVTGFLTTAQLDSIRPFFHLPWHPRVYVANSQSTAIPYIFGSIECTTFANQHVPQDATTAKAHASNDRVLADVAVNNAQLAAVPSTEEIAARLLTAPANKLATSAAGSVTASNTVDEQAVATVVGDVLVDREITTNSGL